MGADGDAALTGDADGVAHGCRVTGVEAARDVRRGHDLKQCVVLARAPASESLSEVGVQIDREEQSPAPYYLRRLLPPLTGFASTTSQSCSSSSNPPRVTLGSS